MLRRSERVRITFNAVLAVKCMSYFDLNFEYASLVVICPFVIHHTIFY